MRAQVITKEDMELDLRVANLKGVKMMAVEAVGCFSEVPPSRDPMFTPRGIAEALKPMGIGIQPVKVSNYQHKIKDGFGLDSRYGSTTDMVRLENLMGEILKDLVGLSGSELLPLRIERLKYNRVIV
jgi:hypothetical protein